MDEAVRIYVPMSKRTAEEKPEIREEEQKVTRQPSHMAPQENSKWKFFLDGKIWSEVLESREKRRQELEHRHPWVEILQNWVLAVLIVMFIIACIVWSVNIWSDKNAVAYAEAALADYQAEQNAIVQAEAQRQAAELASEETALKSMTVVGQKMTYGIRNFIDKYHYSKEDIRTYIRCPLDRLDKKLVAMPADEREELTNRDIADMFEEIVSQKEQFLAYSSSNLALEEYYDVIYDELKTWMHETSKPWDINYQWAELTPNGIFLTNEFGADGYARRVHY